MFSVPKSTTSGCFQRRRLLTAVLFGIAGCEIGTLGDDEAGEQIEDICEDEQCELKIKCVGLEPPATTKPEGTVYDAFCGDEFQGGMFQEAIEIECAKRNTFWPITDAQFIECAGSLPDPDGCTSWHPSRDVQQANGVYVVEQEFVDSVVSLPTPLWDCDTARIQPTPNAEDGYRITNLSSEDLFYALGLRDGDIFVELNGYPIVEYYAIVSTLTYLRAIGEKKFELVVRRHEDTTSLRIEITR